MAEFGESALGSWVEHAFGSRIASQGGFATIESQDRRINMSEPEEDPEDDERSERFSDSMQRFLEISIPKIPVIPPDIFDSAALGFSAPLFETVRKAAESQTNQIQAMFSTLPRLDFASLLPPASLNLASQIGKAFEMPNRALLDNLIPTVSLNALRFDVENAFSNVIKSLNIPTNLGDLVPKWFTPELLDQMRDLMRIGRPQNWDDSIDDEAAQALAADGWPIVWVPRASIVAELVDAEDDNARRLILVAHADQIFDDCDTALASVEAEELDLLRDSQGRPCRLLVRTSSGSLRLGLPSSRIPHAICWG